MISYIKGVLAHKDTKQVTVDVNGVGYAVDVPPSTLTDLPPVGDTVTFYIYYHQSRDNKITLYGFTSRDALKVFELALTVTGVGPGLAQNIVARLSPAQFQRAIHHGDTAALTRVPRVTTDLAQAIISKLKKNIMKMQLEVDVDLENTVSLNTEVLEILINLGASELQAEKAVEKAQKILGPSAKRENLVQHALRYIQN
jgi:Holliday junction DNA helicase RuvA